MPVFEMVVLLTEEPRIATSDIAKLRDVLKGGSSLGSLGVHFSEQVLCCTLRIG